MACYLDLLDDPAGRRVTLAGEPVTVGRHPSCGVQLPSSAVSRQHALVTCEHGDYWLDDLGSRNGTLLNGKRIDRATRLQPGDLIVVCDQRLRFGAEVGEGLDVTLLDAPAGGEIVSTIDVRGGSACRVDAERALQAVLAVTRELGRGADLEQLLPRVLDHVFALYPHADQGVIVLADERGALRPAAARSRGAATGGLQVSRTVIERAMQGRQAVLSTDAATDAQFGGSHSLMALPIRSLMCAPLLGSGDQALGVIQLHSEAAHAPFTGDCLDVLASVANAVGIAVQNAQLHAAQLEQERLVRDLQNAHEVQRSLLPRRLPEMPGFEFFAHYEPARAVGGDYYCFVGGRDGKLAVGVADVSGKGLPAALQMARLSADVRHALGQTADPAEVLALIDDALLESSPESQFVTFALAVLDPRTHRLSFANAGHPPPLLRDASGAVRPLRAERTGVPLNVAGEPALRGTTGALELAVGEVVVLYSDGITEARAGDEEFGEARLNAAVAAAGGGAEAVGRSVLDALNAFVGDGEAHDDVTVVCFAC